MIKNESERTYFCIGIIFFLFLFSGNCHSQSITAVTFPSSKQLGTADTIRINSTTDTPNSISALENYSFNYDTIIINLKHCITMLDLNGVVTVKAVIPPQPQGKYKVKVNLKTFNSIWNPSCNIEYERHIWYDSIEVNSKYTGLKELINSNRQYIVYPNPANDNLKLLSTDKTKISKVIILDFIGRVVYESSEFDAEINISHLNKGIYNLVIIDVDNAIISHKILKE